MDYELIIIGAGVVGLAVSAELSKKFNCALIERHENFGMETSSRNSEVIHAGIYYPKNSLKAKFCVKGNISIKEYCKENNIEFQNTGKLIIANSTEEKNRLKEIYKNGVECGVDSLQFLNKAEIKNLEENIRAENAIFSPNTGIINSHQLMERFELEAIQNSCDMIYRHEVINVEKRDNLFSIRVKDSDNDEFVIKSKYLVNCAGLGSENIAKLAGIDTIKAGYKLNYCRGHYFRLKPSMSNIAKYLIYPATPKGSANLGIHLTKELDGSVKFGPDAEFLKENLQIYEVREELKQKFIKAIKEYLPDISESDIEADQSGIRPKLQSPSGDFRDFVINEESDKGLEGLINLIGIESPGLTSCIEIAKYVNSLIR